MRLSLISLLGFIAINLWAQNPDLPSDFLSKDFHKERRQKLREKLPAKSVAVFFANAEQVGDRVRELVAQHKPRVLMLDLSRVFDIEYSALQVMTEGERRFAEEGVTVWLAGLNPDVLDYIRASGLADRLGKDRMFANARAGISSYLRASELAARNMPDSPQDTSGQAE